MLFCRAKELAYISHRSNPITTSDVRITASHSGKDGDVLPHNNGEIWDVELSEWRGKQWRQTRVQGDRNNNGARRRRDNYSL